MPKQRLRGEFTDPQSCSIFFAAREPVTNHARAHYALALGGQDPAAAQRWALEAWRGGEMSATAEAAIYAMFGGQFTQDDNDRADGRPAVAARSRGRHAPA